jgi:two-component system cell cycle sensor histidine kinase PleC
VKFTPTGGNIQVVGNHDADGVTLRVVDNGIGMEPADIAAALTPFKQVDNSLARKYEGTGLGLPLAKSLLEMHGGSLDLVSELGSGTAAICRLPAARIVPR